MDRGRLRAWDLDHVWHPYTQMADFAGDASRSSSPPTASTSSTPMAGATSTAGLPKAFFSDNGSTAVEAGLKMALQFWHLEGARERCRVASFDGAYHGGGLPFPGHPRPGQNGG